MARNSGNRRFRPGLILASWICVAAVIAAAVVTRVVAGGMVAAARGVFFAGIALALVGLVFSTRSGLFGGTVGSPLSALDQQQRRQVLLEVQGRRQADPTHLDVARSFAYRQSHPSRGLPFLFGGLVLMGIAGLFGHPSGLRVAILAVAAAFFLGLLAFGVVQARRARRFLAEHPADDRSKGDE